MAPSRRSPPRNDDLDYDLEDAVLIEDATEGRVGESQLILEVDSVLSAPRGRECLPERRRRLLLGWAAAGVLLVLVSLAIRSSVSRTKGGGNAVAPGALGFELLRSEVLEDFNYTGNLYRHIATGAQVLSVAAPDPNKAVGLVFKTPVTDDKGKPHILEHCVLEGSDNFPVQHPPPFDRLAQGSTTTYLNAFTNPDRTVYPVSSANLKEFYNVARVYMDAVFRPLVREQEMIFRQEGWRLELPDASDPAGAELAGVVLNEMRGAFSGPQSWLQRLYTQNLFPDTGYAFSSGGFPSAIPSLEYEELQRFHADHYHPSNARVWFYGDDPEDERLRLLAAALEGLEETAPPAQAPPEVKAQPRFEAPRSANGTYPAATGEKAIAAVVWVLTEGSGGLPEADALPMEVLEDLLFGTTTAAMYAALRSSGYGTPLEDMLGLDTGYVQPLMMAAVQDLEPEEVPAVHALVLETLVRLSEEGFPAEDVEAAINSHEVSSKRAASESVSWGVDLLKGVAGPWVWGRDPFAEFRRVERPLAALRARLEAKEDVFGDLLRRYLLDNPHRLDAALLPSLPMATGQGAEEQGLVDGLLAAGAGAAERWADLSKRMEEFHDAEDPEELEDVVPLLGAADIDPGVTVAPTTAEKVPGGTVLLHPQPTAGIVFFRVALRLDGLADDDDIALVPLAARMLREGGTESEAPRELEARIGRLTGGVEVSVETLEEASEGSDRDEGSPPAALPFLLISGTAEGERSEDLAGVIGDLLLLDGLGREGAGDLAEEILSSWIGEIETEMLGDGLGPALSRARAMSSPAGWILEQTGGISQLETLRAARDSLEGDGYGGWPRLRERLRGVLEAIVKPPPSSSAPGSGSGSGSCVPAPLVSVTADDATIESSARAAAAGLLGRLREAAAGASSGFCGADEAPSGRRAWRTLPSRSEAVQIASGNNHVAEVAVSGLLEGGGAQAAAQVLKNYLHLEVRAKRGAYGAYASISDWGRLSLYTYRDPGLATTTEVFGNASQYLVDWSRAPDAKELEAAVVNAAASLDPYLPASQRGLNAMYDFIRGRTEAGLRRRKSELLAATAEDVRRLGEAMGGATFDLVAATTDIAALAADGKAMFDAVVQVVRANGTDDRGNSSGSDN